MGQAAEIADPVRRLVEPGCWLKKVSVTVARRVDGVDVETEYLWAMAEPDRG